MTYIQLINNENEEAGLYDSPYDFDTTEAFITEAFARAEKDREKIRSRFYTGIAEAMVEQWIF